MRRVRKTTVQWKINKYYILRVCVYSLRYLARNALYYMVICDLRVCTICIHIIS